MSEIKGQLLGIFLVLGLFAAISAAAYAIFDTTAKGVAHQVENVTNEVVEVVDVEPGA